ncbi:MAG: 50S ribosomal protein L22 [Candidatus Aminicenantes bacterium]|nr:50S ribosomal protein L22 [Candidatus Aminicenantes bacterium]
MSQPTTVAKATTRFLRISPQKCRLVADLIRKRFVGEALTILKFSKKRKASVLIEKVLRSAIANAQQKESNLNVDDLVVSSIQIDGGPSAKRIRPAPMGRAYRVLKRTSHIHITLEERKGR